MAHCHAPGAFVNLLTEPLLDTLSGLVAVGLAQTELILTIADPSLHRCRSHAVIHSIVGINECHRALTRLLFYGRIVAGNLHAQGIIAQRGQLGMRPRMIAQFMARTNQRAAFFPRHAWRIMVIQITNIVSVDGKRRLQRIAIQMRCNERIILLHPIVERQAHRTHAITLIPSNTHFLC